MLSLITLSDFPFLKGTVLLPFKKLSFFYINVESVLDVLLMHLYVLSVFLKVLVMLM
jgi:hypothetical protein